MNSTLHSCPDIDGFSPLGSNPDTISDILSGHLKVALCLDKSPDKSPDIMSTVGSGKAK
jgi:hypothetical protein